MLFAHVCLPVVEEYAAAPKKKVWILYELILHFRRVLDCLGQVAQIGRDQRLQHQTRVFDGVGALFQDLAEVGFGLLPRFLFHGLVDVALTLDQRLYLLADPVRGFLPQGDGLLDGRLGLRQLTELDVARGSAQVRLRELTVDEERVFAVSQSKFELLLLQVGHCAIRVYTFLLLTL